MAGHWKLNKLIVLYDDNGISIDGPTSIADSVDQVKRFKSAGWAAELIDGHDPKAIAAAITRAQKSNKPSLIACKTTIGFGAPTRAGTAKAHGEALGAEELKGAKQKLGISLDAVFGAGRRAEGLARGRQPRRRGAQGMGERNSPNSATASAPNSNAACGTSGRPRWRRRSRRTRRRCSRRRRISPPANRRNP